MIDSPQIPEEEFKEPREFHWVRWSFLALGMLAAAAILVVVLAPQSSLGKRIVDTVDRVAAMVGAPSWQARYQASSDAKATPAPTPRGVAALGRVEPEDGVIRVTAPYYAGRPSVVRELRVREGDQVQAGQLLAVLDSKPQVEAALQQAGTRVRAARSRVAQVQAGPKTADVAAYEQERDRWQAVLDAARTELKRYEPLLASGAVPAAVVDEKRLAVVNAERMIAQITQRIKSLSEVRQSDLDVAQAELTAALADEERARGELSLAVVSSPVSGRVLSIQARPGEEVSVKGLLDLAKKGPMFVVAEVNERDISRIRVGQAANIHGESLEHDVAGRVERIERQVGPSEVLPVDPMAFSDMRVVRVRILALDPSVLENRIRARVSVVFEP